MRSECFFCGADTVHAGRDTGIYSCLEQDFDNLLPADAYVHCSPDMKFELPWRVSHRHQGRYDEHFPGAQVYAGAGDNIREGEAKHQLGKVTRQAIEIGCDLLRRFWVELREQSKGPSAPAIKLIAIHAFTPFMPSSV